jgi:hypothetical protein
MIKTQSETNHSVQPAALSLIPEASAEQGSSYRCSLRAKPPLTGLAVLVRVLSLERRTTIGALATLTGQGTGVGDI